MRKLRLLSIGQSESNQPVLGACSRSAQRSAIDSKLFFMMLFSVDPPVEQIAKQANNKKQSEGAKQYCELYAKKSRPKISVSHI
jgi:hypothetical protein